jgi:lysophospholipase L1-like esterase
VKPVLGAKNDFVYYILLFFMVCVLMMNYFAKRFSKSIKELREFSLQLKSGQPISEPVNYVDDEIGEISADIAGNTGPSTLEMIEDNLYSMTELAQFHGIRVVLCSVLPAADYPWRPGLNPAPKIVELNRRIKEYAQKHHAIYCDYFSAMADENNGLPKKFSEDGVHPNKEGYVLMAPLVESALSEALKIPSIKVGD